MSDELAHAQLALLCCEPWEFLKYRKLKKRIKQLEAIEGNPKNDKVSQYS